MAGREWKALPTLTSMHCILLISSLSITNDQAENNLRAVGRVLSRLTRQLSKIETPMKYQHPNFINVQGNSETQIQDGRPRQSKNKYSRRLLTEITNKSDKDNSESQYSSQSSELVDYGTSPEMRIQSFEDYDWEQDRMIRYGLNDHGVIEPKEYDS